VVIKEEKYKTKQRYRKRERKRVREGKCTKPAF
jgi:hypothetical protein